MRRRSHSGSHAVSLWARSVKRWGSWLCLTMLCLSVALLVLRVVERDGTGRITLAAFSVLTWVSLLAANEHSRRKRRSLPPSHRP